MRARVFAAVVAVLFAATALASSVFVGRGYGLPSSFSSTYSLEELGLLAGVGRVSGRPVVYEWPIVTLLKPGKTDITVNIINLRFKCSSGERPVEIIVDASGSRYASNSTSLSVTLDRNSIFLIIKIKIIINSRCVTPVSTPLATVRITTTG